MNWTPEKIEELKHFWKIGLSCSQIARRLQDGCTRNAVIGKVHRLGLPNRDRPSRPMRLLVRERRSPVNAAKLKQRSKLKPILLSSVAELPALNVRFDDLGPRMCRWVTTAEAPHLFCGQPVLEGKPYCPAHAERAYLRPYRVHLGVPWEANVIDAGRTQSWRKAA